MIFSLLSSAAITAGERETRVAGIRIIKFVDVCHQLGRNLGNLGEEVKSEQ
jgi:hypothetical protein